MLKNNHKDEYYIDKYEEVKDYAASKGLTNPFRNWREFKSEYESIRESGSKQIMREIRYSVEYATDYKTALNAYRSIREHGGDLRFKEVKKMSTREIADIYKKQILEDYRELKEYGADATSAKMFLSMNWFGSK